MPVVGELYDAISGEQERRFPPVVYKASDDPADELHMQFQAAALESSEWNAMREQAETAGEAELFEMAIKIHSVCMLSWNLTSAGQPMAITSEVLRGLGFKNLAAMLLLCAQRYPLVDWTERGGKAAGASRLTRKVALQRIAALMSRALMLTANIEDIDHVA